MTPELARVLERVKQTRAATRTPSARAFSTQVPGTAESGSAFAIGARAFDTVSGLEGEVIGHASENIIVPATKGTNG